MITTKITEVPKEDKVKSFSYKEIYANKLGGTYAVNQAGYEKWNATFLFNNNGECVLFITENGGIFRAFFTQQELSNKNIGWGKGDCKYVPVNKTLTLEVTSD